MGWAQAASIIAAVTGVIGLQSFWIARSLDAFRDELRALRAELHRSVDRLDGRLDRLEGQGPPPSLRRV